MKGKCCPVTKASHILVLVGAINWGLIGAFNWDLVNTILGSISWLERLVYVLIGLSGLFLLSKMCMGCKSGKKECCGSGKCSTEGKGGSCSGK